MLEIKKILLASDLSDNSEKALHYAQYFTSQFKAELHVLHVLEDIPSSTPLFGGGLALTSSVHESATVAERNMRNLFDKAWISGKQIVVATAEGKPGAAILEYASEHQIDLIIVGTHGRSGLSHVLLGSVAEQITKQAQCPVLVVRSPSTN